MSGGSGVTSVTEWERSARDADLWMLPEALACIFYIVQSMLGACSS